MTLNSSIQQHAMRYRRRRSAKCRTHSLDVSDNRWAVSPVLEPRHSTVRRSVVQTGALIIVCSLACCVEGRGWACNTSLCISLILVCVCDFCSCLFTIHRSYYLLIRRWQLTHCLASAGGQLLRPHSVYKLVSLQQPLNLLSC
jgi:hypothetical protein